MSQLFTKEHIPIICVPITGTSKETIEEQLEQSLVEKPDMIEWRVDFFNEIADEAAVLEVIQLIKTKSELPLLFTIRSEQEGGERISLNEKDIVRLIEIISEKSEVDFIDYEVANERENVQIVRDITEKHNKQLVLSYHNFSETLTNEQMLKTALQMEFYKADVAKLAFMPRCEDDVFRLLQVTKQLEQLLEIPIVTMSMGELGAISRVIGWTFGSVLTFAVGVESSAPGQIPIGKLRRAIDAIKETINIE